MKPGSAANETVNNMNEYPGPKAPEKNFRQIIDNLNVGVVLLGRDLKVIAMNRLMKHWFPTPLSLGQPTCYQIIQPQSQNNHCPDCPVQKTLNDGRIREVNTSLVRDGKKCDFRTICSPIFNENDEVTSVIRLFEDITEKNALARELAQSQKMASIGQLAAGVAHEINNPTGFISSNLKTLDDYQKDLRVLIDAYQGLLQLIKNHSDIVGSPPISKELENIKRLEADIDIDFIKEDMGALIAESREGTERIKNIVNDLKRFAHPGQDQVQDTDINACLVSTLNIVNNELKYKADIITNLGDLPIVAANPQQVNQVFVNLLVNAAQAIETKGEIRIETRLIHDEVEIRVSDNGCGIPTENLDKIFDPFFTTKDVGKGTGMGMNIVYNIIKKHNGSINVESTVGEGTTFIIRLPVDRDMDQGNGR